MSPDEVLEVIDNMRLLLSELEEQTEEGRVLDGNRTYDLNLSYEKLSFAVHGD